MVRTLRVVVASLFAAALGVGAGPSVGNATQVRLAIDTDNSTVTGCNWNLEDASGVSVVGGVERVVVAILDSVSVLRVEILNCEGSSYATPIEVATGSWPVGLGTGLSGSDTLEFAVPMNLLGGGPVLRLYADAVSIAGEDALATTNGTLEGDPILFSLAAGVPGLDWAGWLVTAALILGLGVTLLRRRTARAVGAVGLSLIALEAAAVITLGLDGQVGEWAATSPVALDAVGDSTGADENSDLVALFAEVDVGIAALAVRIDVVSLNDDTPAPEIPGMAFVAAGAFEMGCRLNNDYETALSNPPQSAAEFTAFDDFARADSEVLGNTPQGDYTWVETASGVGPEGGSRIQISNQVAAINYFAGGEGAFPVLQANLAGLSAQNVDLTVRFRCPVPNYCALDRTFGQSWRLAADSGDFNDAGYHLQIAPLSGGSGLDAGIHLYAGFTLLNSAPIAIDFDFHTYRIVSVGPAHKVYFDDVLLINEVDSTYPEAGFVGVGTYFSLSQFDDFGVTDLGADMIHSDTQCGEDEQPSHSVILSNFSIDLNEVTAAEYKACVDEGGCTYTGNPADSRRTYEVSGRENHPINYVSWQDAADYCTWRGKRLPTEAEWEKAARGTDGRIYPWGDSPVPNCDGYAVVPLDGLGGCETAGPLEGGQKPLGISPYGATDMIGNVWEWVADWYVSDFYCSGNGGDTSEPFTNCIATDTPHLDAITDPTGPGSGSLKVLRGGSYAASSSNPEDYENHRASTRAAVNPTSQSPAFGFRCAL